jgi:hypothetical protein
MKKLLFLMLISALLCNSLTAQHLLRVNNNTDFDADFTTLQAAVTAASNNDTIYVEGSAIEYEGATINKPLTIVGPGFFLSENPKTQANNVSATFNTNITFASGSEGSTIMGCRIHYVADLIISVSEITVIRNDLYDVEFTGTCNNILVAQNWVYSIDATSGQITNTIISNNIISSAIYSGNTSGSLIVSNNVFTYSGGYFGGISVYNATIQNNILSGSNNQIREWSGNTISYNLLAGVGTNSNGNQYNIDMTLVFADYNGTLGLSTEGKWDLMAGSPAIGAGNGGVDCGAFDGPTPYVLSGIPNLPHIYEADVPASATSESGLEVSIKVMSGD